MNKKINDILVAGCALFAMFFGAGNLVFPPSLGLISGSAWYLSLSGFLLTGVGLPILGIISVEKCGGELSNFTKNINGKLGTLFILLVMLIIGPLFGIPRTAATVFEITVKPLGLGFNQLLTSFIFFALTIFFVLTPNSIVDRVGKFLTPALIAVVALFIIKGIVTPIGTLTKTPLENAYLHGFKEGYQTMDALASIIFATIIISAIKAKGYTEKKEMLKITVCIGLAAGIGLSAVYSGLVYAGAVSNSILPHSLSRAELLVKMSEILWSKAGRAVLGLSMGLACLTTSIGLTATSGKYFNELFKNKPGYKVWVLIVALVSLFLSNSGLDKIIYVAVPVLEIVYPVVIVFIIMNIISDYIPNRYFYSGAVIGTLCISLLKGFVAAAGLFEELVGSIGLEPFVADITAFLQKLLLSTIDLAWLLPALTASAVLGFGSMLLKKAAASKTACNFK